MKRGFVEQVHDIQDVCRLTGLAKSQVLFFMRKFADLLSHPGQGYLRHQYSEKQVARLREIARLVQQEGLDPASVGSILACGITDGSPARILAVTSGKGGVGKTFIAVNMAIAFARDGYKTLLVDADMGMANVHVYAGVRPTRTVSDYFEAHRPFETLPLTGPGGVDIVCGASGRADLAEWPTEHFSVFLDDLRAHARNYDIVILDTAAGIGSHVMQCLSVADDIIIVTTPSMASILDAYGAIKACKGASAKGIVGLLVNRVHGAAEAKGVYANIRQCTKRFLEVTPQDHGWILEHVDVETSLSNQHPLLLLPNTDPGITDAFYRWPVRYRDIGSEVRGAHDKERSCLPPSERAVHTLPTRRRFSQGAYKAHLIQGER